MNYWTDERIETLKSLWASGISAALIAEKLGDGATKNSVIGKIHRLKLAGTGETRTPRVRAEKADRKPRAKRMPSSRQDSVRRTARHIDGVFEEAGYSLPTEIAFELPPTDAFGIDALLALTETTCKWPIGEVLDPQFRFCGDAAHGKGAYCEYHARKARSPETRRRAA